jgi:putative zinc finger/helix-turn-helix YgiT family protein
MSRTGRARPVRAARAARGGAACLDCGGALRISREPHKYTLHPKWAITITDAEFRRCPKCGCFEVMIPKPDALHRTIAAEVIRKPAKLSGPELVFLRTELRMSARKLAKVIGVVHESISRWENDILPVSPPVDRLMRTMVALTIAGEKFPVETLSQIEGDAGPLKLVVTVDQKGSWKRAA